MTNCKDEFLEHVEERQILCAVIREVYYDIEEPDRKSFVLKPGFSDLDFKLFLKSIDFEYYSGHGAQNLDGTIWYTDGTWSDRGEYDGAEWWEYRKCPEISLLEKISAL
jgi:hypothetical protein